MISELIPKTFLTLLIVLCSSASFLTFTFSTMSYTPQVALDSTTPLPLRAFLHWSLLQESNLGITDADKILSAGKTVSLSVRPHDLLCDFTGLE